jgi:hypothetical protein
MRIPQLRKNTERAIGCQGTARQPGQNLPTRKSRIHKAATVGRAERAAATRAFGVRRLVAAFFFWPMTALTAKEKKKATTSCRTPESRPLVA